MAIPGLDSDYPVPPPRGPLAIKGQVRVRSGENDAEVVGITVGPGTFGDAPPNVFLGNIVNEVDPIRNWDWATFAGVGLTYTVSALGANFVDLKGRDVQAWSVAATTQSWNYPPDLANEDMILVAVHTGGLTTHSTPASWTLVGSQATSSSRLSLYKRIIDGTEALTESFTLGTAAGGLVHTWTFDRAQGGVEVTAALNDSPAGTSLNIGAVSPTWASGGATNTYYIALLGLDVESGSTVSAFPTSYVDTTQNSIASATASINCRTAYAERKVSGTTEDPSAFTYGAARAAGFIIAIRGKDAGQLDATGGGAAGWDDVLLNDPHSGVSNPIVDTGQFIQFGTTAGAVATGQARTNFDFLFNADKSWHLLAGEAIDLDSSDSSSWVVDNGGLTLESFDSLSIESVDSSVTIDALTSITLTAPFVSVATGFLRFNEAAASTPSMAAGQALYWVKNNAPNDPFFTDDTNADRQIATFPIPLGGFATIANDTFLGNVSGSTAAPSAVNLSTLAGAGLVFGTHTLDVTAGAGGSLVVGANDIQRGALTGAITATQDSGVTAFGVLAAKSVLANATNASAVPAALAGSAAFQHLRVNSANTGLEWSVLTAGDFPAGVVPLTGLASQAADTFVGRLAGAGSPTAQLLADIDSTSIIYDATSHTFQLGAHTGDVTSTQNGLALTIAADAVTNAKLADMTALSVKGNATNAGANPTDIASSADDTVFRRTATTLNWGGLTVGMAANDLWTYAKIQNVSATSRILGRITAGAGDIEELTGTQATTLLDNFTSTLKGLAPLSGGGTTNFLRADGTWAAPPGANPGHLIRVDGVDQTQRAAVNFVDTGDVLFTPTDDAANGETELRATFATVATNTMAANATAGTAAYTPLAISAESIPGRTSGNITQITSAVQSILMRSSGSLFFGTAAADQVLRRSGSGDLGFGTLVTNNIGADQITNALLADMAAKTVKVNATNAAANPTDLAGSAAFQHLRVNSANTGLEWSVLTAGDFPADVVPIASIATIAANTVLANATAGVTNATAFALATNELLGRTSGNITGVTVNTNTVVGRVAGNMVAAQLVGAQVTTNTLAYTKLAQTATGRKLLGNTSDGADNIIELDQLTTTMLMALPATNNSHGIMWEDEDFTMARTVYSGFTVNAGTVADVFNGTTGVNGHWYVTSGTGNSAVTFLGTGTIGHKGIIRLTTANANGNSCALYLGRDGGSTLPTEAVFDADDFLSMDWYVMLPELTLKFVNIGIGQNVGDANFGTESAFFFYDSSAGANWFAAVRAASTYNVNTDVGFAAVAGSWVKLTIRRVSSSAWDFYINNALFLSSSGAGPTGGVLPGALVSTRTTASKNLDVDRCRIFLNDRALFD